MRLARTTRGWVLGATSWCGYLRMRAIEGEDIIGDPERLAVAGKVRAYGTRAEGIAAMREVLS